MFLVQQETNNPRQRDTDPTSENHLAGSPLVSEQGSLQTLAFYNRDIS